MKLFCKQRFDVNFKPSPEASHSLLLLPGSFGSGAFGRGRGRGKGRGNKGKGKGKQKGKTKSMGKDIGKKGKNKGKVDSTHCRVRYEYGHWSRECPNGMVQQVVNQTLQHPSEQHPSESSYPSFTTASTVRRIFTIPMRIPTLSSTSSSARMISAGPETAGDVVILDSGSDVSLLPPSYGQCGVDAINPEKVQLCDCQGEHLQVTGYRIVSLVVPDESGEEGG